MSTLTFDKSGSGLLSENVIQFSNVIDAAAKLSSSQERSNMSALKKTNKGFYGLSFGFPVKDESNGGSNHAKLKSFLQLREFHRYLLNTNNVDTQTFNVLGLVPTFTPGRKPYSGLTDTTGSIYISGPDFTTALFEEKQCKLLLDSNNLSSEVTVNIQLQSKLKKSQIKDAPFYRLDIYSSEMCLNLVKALTDGRDISNKWLRLLTEIDSNDEMIPSILCVKIHYQDLFRTPYSDLTTATTMLATQHAEQSLYNHNTNYKGEFSQRTKFKENSRTTPAYLTIGSSALKDYCVIKLETLFDGSKGLSIYYAAQRRLAHQAFQLMLNKSFDDKVKYIAKGLFFDLLCDCEKSNKNNLFYGLFAALEKEQTNQYSFRTLVSGITEEKKPWLYRMVRSLINYFKNQDDFDESFDANTKNDKKITINEQQVMVEFIAAMLPLIQESAIRDKTLTKTIVNVFEPLNTVIQADFNPSDAALKTALQKTKPEVASQLYKMMSERLMESISSLDEFKRFSMLLSKLSESSLDKLAPTSTQQLADSKILVESWFFNEAKQVIDGTFLSDKLRQLLYIKATDAVDGETGALAQLRAALVFVGYYIYEYNAEQPSAINKGASVKSFLEAYSSTSYPFMLLDLASESSDKNSRFSLYLNDVFAEANGKTKTTNFQLPSVENSKTEMLKALALIFGDYWGYNKKNSDVEQVTKAIINNVEILTFPTWVEAVKYYFPTMEMFTSSIIGSINQTINDNYIFSKNERLAFASLQKPFLDSELLPLHRLLLMLEFSITDNELGNLNRVAGLKLGFRSSFSQFPSILLPDETSALKAYAALVLLRIKQQTSDSGRGKLQWNNLVKTKKNELPEEKLEQAIERFYTSLLISKKQFSPYELYRGLEFLYTLENNSTSRPFYSIFIKAIFQLELKPSDEKSLLNSTLGLNNLSEKIFDKKIDVMSVWCALVDNITSSQGTILSRSGSLELNSLDDLSSLEDPPSDDDEN